MSLNLWWLLLLAVLILFPLAVLKPSARQKSLILLREKARSLGIQVNVVPSQITPQLRLEGAAYRWLTPLDVKKSISYLCVHKQGVKSQTAMPEASNLKFIQDWGVVVGNLEQLTPKQQQDLASWLQHLPEDAYAVEWGAAGLSFWWQELSLDVDLASLAQQAEQLLRQS